MRARPGCHVPIPWCTLSTTSRTFGTCPQAINRDSPVRLCDCSPIPSHSCAPQPKVVNLGDPELSLILRKPLSPDGQGGPHPASPTGLTHVGGPRWDSTEHPVYKAILAWIREASPVPNGSEVSVDASRVK